MMRAKFIYEYLELPGKSKEQIIRDLSLLSKEEKDKKLIESSWDDNKDIVELLLNAGADVNAKDKNGYTALINASYYGHKDIVKMLLDAGADVNVKDVYGWTALMWASDKDHKDIIRLLKKHGAII